MTVKPKNQTGSVSWETKVLLMAEIENEKFGGSSPATLQTAIDSVKQGYVPREWMTAHTMEKVLRELTLMQSLNGKKVRAEDFLCDADWSRRASEISPELGLPGHAEKKDYEVITLQVMVEKTKAGEAFDKLKATAGAVGVCTVRVYGKEVTDEDWAIALPASMGRMLSEPAQAESGGPGR